MKIHNYGNDYAQSMKFQNNEKGNVANRVKLDSSKVGKKTAELPEAKESSIVEETIGGSKESHKGKKEKKRTSKK